MVFIFSRISDLFNYLISDPIGFIIFIIYFSIALVVTLVIHEYAHGYVAFRCGDNTARVLGRLSLNPLKHLDPLGTLCMILFGFGWAKPVPINSRNFKNPLKDEIYVSFAGVICNLTLFLLSTAIMIAINRYVWIPQILEQYSYYDLLHSNSIGSYYILSSLYIEQNQLINSMLMAHIMRFFMLLSQFNLIIAIFNLIPVPPLDGFHIINNLVFKGKLSMNPNTMQVIQVLFMVLLFSGAFQGVLTFLSNIIETGVLRTFLQLIGK